MSTAPPLDPAEFFPVALIHLPINPTLAPIVMLDPDAAGARSAEAAARVVEAYHAAMRAPAVPAPSMWALIEGKHAEFFAAVRDRDLATVQSTLARLFHTSLIWGLGRVHPDTPTHIREGQPEGVQIQITDALVSLAEATGAWRITCLEQQGVAGHLAALQVDITALLEAVVQRTKLDVGLPVVGANYGCQIGGRRVSIDSLVHSYTAYRLKELGVAPGDRIVEIGGGYGCLAYVCRRNGFADYTIVDLPWVNLIQGYVLIMSLPPDSVSLFGEPERAVKVRPFWEFGKLAHRSVDVVINTDSLPELGQETGREYIHGIGRVIRKYFLSINQEAMSEYPGVGPQLHVNGLAAENPELRLLHRHRYWMRQGYVEEVFAPSGSASAAAMNRAKRAVRWVKRQLRRNGAAVVLLGAILLGGCGGEKGVDDPANELPFGHVDTPVEGAQVTALAPVAGWAMDDRGVREIRVYVDGYLVSHGSPTNERPDVSRAFPKYAHSGNRHGWTLTMAFTEPGRHAVVVQAVDENGATRDIGAMTVNAVDR